MADVLRPCSHIMTPTPGDTQQRSRGTGGGGSWATTGDHGHEILFGGHGDLILAAGDSGCVICLDALENTLLDALFTTLLNACLDALLNTLLITLLDAFQTNISNNVQAPSMF